MYADQAGHEAMQSGEPVYRQIVERFGPSVVNRDGSINRSKLAEIAFGSGRIEELNRLVHPAVRERMERWFEETSEFDPRAIMIFEAALILEAGLGKYFDKLIVVTSKQDQKLDRFANRAVTGKVNSEEERLRALRDAERRIGAQLSEEEKISAADYVIDNSGTIAETEKQVSRIYRELQEAASLPTQPVTS